MKQTQPVNRPIYIFFYIQWSVITVYIACEPRYRKACIYSHGFINPLCRSDLSAENRCVWKGNRPPVSLKPCPHCRRKGRLSQKTARQQRQSHFSATVWKAFRLSTVANRSFPVVAARIWNDLPADLTSAESLSTFRQQLKTQSVSEVISGYFVFCLDL